MALTQADLPVMYTLLSNSLSGDDSLRKPAEAALSHNENRPGFCFCLLVPASFCVDCIVFFFVFSRR